MKVLVRPFYGWGWFRSDEKQAMPTPPEFTFEVDVLQPGSPFKLAVGTVTQPNHPLTGLWVALSQRHTIPDGHFNLAGYADRPERPFGDPGILNGYASVSQISDA